jgi:hypothetical protein
VHDDPVYERTARAAGADGFLLKKTAGTALWPALTPLVTGTPGTEVMKAVVRPRLSALRRDRRGLASGIFPVHVQGSARLADLAEPAIAPYRGPTRVSRRAGWRDLGILKDRASTADTEEGGQ